MTHALAVAVERAGVPSREHLRAVAAMLRTVGTVALVMAVTVGICLVVVALLAASGILTASTAGI